MANRTAADSLPVRRNVAKAVPAKRAARTADRHAAIAKKPAKRAAPRDFREGSKLALVITMMRAKNGASLTALAKKTGWTDSALRTSVSKLKNVTGYAIENIGERGEPVYHIAR